MRFLAVLFSVMLLAGCANTEEKIYTPLSLSQINSWALGFQYEAGAREFTQKSSGDTEVRIINEGRSANDLALRDDIFWSLKDDHSIKVVKSLKSGGGRILIHPVGLSSVSVVFEDEAKEPLARIKIKNGTRNATYKRADDFAKYVAEAIADVIKGKK